MAQALLVNSELTTTMVAAGRRLLAHLDSRNVIFDAALWLRDDELGEWRLMLSNADVRRNGPKVYYHCLNLAISELKLADVLRIEMISVVDAHTPLIELLLNALGVAASVDGARLDNAIIGTERLPGCLLYRLTRKQALAAQALSTALA